MNLLNGGLIWGAAACLVPLVIHILNRSRFRTVEWGAMHLLESVIEVNHRRFHVEQILLLLLRCSLPVLLALCLARPVLTGAAALPGDAPVSMVIVLDNSYSMDTAAVEATRFQQAVDAARDVIGHLHRGSDISVILPGGGPVRLFAEPVFDQEAVERQLMALTAGYGASDMVAGIDEAIQTLSGMTQPRRELLVISDFQAADWETITGGVGDSIRQQLEGLPFDTAVTLMPVGRSAPSNICVEKIEQPNRAVGIGQTVPLRVHLRNHGTEVAAATQVTLFLDDQQQAEQQVRLEASGTTQVVFPVTFETAGSHVVTVEINVDDPLPTDNRLSIAVPVWEQIPVLLVDGQPNTRPLKSETDFLSIALTPLTFGRTGLSDLVRTSTVDAGRLTRDDLKGQVVVVLANVAQLNDDLLAAVTAFVEGGGVLIVFPGGVLDLNWYQQHMYAQGNGLLPFAFGAIQGQSADEAESAHIVAQRFDHPALEFFNNPQNGTLSRVEVRKWFRLTVPRDTAAPEDSERQAVEVGSQTGVLARLDNADVFLAERRRGDGVVLQLCTACDADWSDLPLRPCYVPLMQNLVTTTAVSAMPARNLSAGDTAVVLFPDAADDAVVSLVTPGGKRQMLKMERSGERGLARYSATQQPGIYRMTLPSAEVVHFVATTSRTESEPGTLEPDALRKTAGLMGATVVQSSRDYRELDQRRRYGREIWKYVLGALLILMLLELVLQQRFAGVRT
jgi:hypothetical protein